MSHFLSADALKSHVIKQMTSRRYVKSFDLSRVLATTARHAMRTWQIKLCMLS